MKVVASILLITLIAFNCKAQEMRFEVEISEQYGLFDFLFNLSQNDPDNPYTKLFSASKFNTSESQTLIKEFNEINIYYTYEYPQYPFGSKIEGNTYFILSRNLIENKDLETFKRKSFGIIPNHDLNKLYEILLVFKPIYNDLILKPCHDKLNLQIKEIQKLISEVDIASFFRKTLHFHNSVWDASLPFKLYIFPIPDYRERGFTATAFYNLAIAGIPQGYRDYHELLSVMFHESFHILYDEQPLEVKNKIEQWFTTHNSKNAVYAQLLFNEAITTAIANGYAHKQYAGKLPNDSWYNNFFISEMAQKIYPTVKEYLDADKSIDKDFIDQYISIFDNNFSDWMLDPKFLLMQRSVIADTQDLSERTLTNYPFSNINEFSLGLSPNTLNRLKNHEVTKVIILRNLEEIRLNLLKDSFPELQNWTPELSTNFVYSKFLDDRTYLIIINFVDEFGNSLLEDLRFGNEDK